MSKKEVDNRIFLITSDYPIPTGTPTLGIEKKSPAEIIQANAKALNVPLMHYLQILSLLNKSDSGPKATDIVRIPSPRPETEHIEDNIKVIDDGLTGGNNDLYALLSNQKQCELSLSFASPFAFNNLNLTRFCTYERYYFNNEPQSDLKDDRTIMAWCNIPFKEVNASVKLQFEEDYVDMKNLIEKVEKNFIRIVTAEDVGGDDEDEDDNMNDEDTEPPLKEETNTVSISNTDVNDVNADSNTNPGNNTQNSTTDQNISNPSLVALKRMLDQQNKDNSSLCKDFSSIIFHPQFAQSFKNTIHNKIGQPYTPAELWRLSYLGSPSDESRYLVRSIINTTIDHNYENFLRFIGYKRDYELLRVGFIFTIDAHIEVRVYRLYKLEQESVPSSAVLISGFHWLMDVRALCTYSDIKYTETQVRSVLNSLDLDLEDEFY